MDKSHEPLNQHLINLPAGTTHIKVGDVPDLLASAFYPLPDSYGRISSRESNKRGVEKAIKAGTITPLIPDSLEDHPFPFGDALDNSVITIKDFKRLAKKAGITQVTDGSAKVRTGDTENESEQPASAPAIEMEKQGIDKREIARAFAGMHFNYDKWLKYLASPPNWLKKCRLKMGSKSASAKWSPVLIAVELLGKGKTPRQLDAVFVDLKDWADEWRERTEIMR